MALINCPDCGAEVSDAASSCPKCARPLGGDTATSPTTISLTSKRLKTHTLAATVTTLLGLLFMIHRATQHVDASFDIGMGVTVLGFVWIALTRFRTWWHHQ